MNEETKKREPGMARLVLILFAITVITALLLGFVNYITAGPIADSKKQKTEEAMKAVLNAEEYVPEPYAGTDPLIQSISRALIGGEQIGWEVSVNPSGFGGAIDMVVGVDMNGLVTGISIVKMTETSGLGTNANKDSYKSQYIGLGAGIAVDKDAVNPGAHRRDHHIPCGHKGRQCSA
jgi:electron transport complex protein RnfG